jgi:NADPH:quinone reductase-like Zn-dependent oxidoreductase
MRAIIIERVGKPVSPNVRLVHDWPDVREPGPGEAVVRTLASALNRMDIWVGAGVPGLELAYPRVSGCDACGVVERVGPGVHPSWVGTRVVVNAATVVARTRAAGAGTEATLAPEYELIGEHHHGMHCERFVVPAANLAPIGPDADPHQAAAFGLVTLTAYSMMCTKAGLLPGQSVLVTGIGGGVALAALALAKWVGCPVAVTSRSADKLERARKLGADLLVHDTGQDWSKEVRAWTGKRGVDMAVDSSGKATHLKCIKSLGRGGVYVTPGCTSGPDATTDLARIFWNQLRILGSTMGTNDEFQEIAALYRAGKIWGVVDHVYAPAAAGEAWRRLEGEEQFGKVVIDWR